ncbi:MAG: DUF86 domain-containing protein [Flavobacteriaceae bacterium]|nr:DUF86 domain-containing protein [Flavobacteriaceae bacterium]MCY4267571.1 DUF86 domain-containing protein [Flavobacteriaceae bacterium]
MTRLENDLRILHIVQDEIHSIFNHLSSHNAYQDFEKDYLVQCVCYKSIVFIGNALKDISEDLRLEHPHIPWHKAIGLRDKVAHLYEELKVNIIWDTVQMDYPRLTSQITQLMKDISNR